jgi:hypothetical protein
MDDVTFLVTNQELVPDPSNVCAGNLIMSKYRLWAFIRIKWGAGGRLTVENGVV